MAALAAESCGDVAVTDFGPVATEIGEAAGEGDGIAACGFVSTTGIGFGAAASVATIALAGEGCEVTEATGADTGAASVADWGFGTASVTGIGAGFAEGTAGTVFVATAAIWAPSPPCIRCNTSAR